MAFTFGFYNSLNGDRRYNAEQFGEIFDGILRDGIIPSIGQLFAVTTANNGMQINVGTGRAWFDHTWNKNDSVMVLTVPLSDVTRSRYDAVVLEVNANDEVRTNSIKIVQGEPLVNPVKPTLVNTSKIHQYPLAYIKVEAGAEVIKPSMIENMVGREPTVFATGVLEVVKIDKLWEQWRGEWNEWFEDIKLQLSGNVATNLQYQIDQLKSTALTDSRKATSSEAIAGTNNTKWMTPSTTAAAIDANLGYVKDTYGNKASITVRNPAIITWSKMGPFQDKIDYGYGKSSKVYDVGDYIITFTLKNNTNSRSPSAGKGYFLSGSSDEASSLTLYATTVRKSDLKQVYHETVGSVSKTASYYALIICTDVKGVKNKVIYSLGQTLYSASVAQNGLVSRTTLSSSFTWTWYYRVRSSSILVGANSNYFFSGVYFTYEQYEGYGTHAIAFAYDFANRTSSTNNTYIDPATKFCLTNSGVLYVYYGVASSSSSNHSIVTCKEININTWSFGSFSFDIKNYNSGFSPVALNGWDVFYDSTYNRIVFGIQGTSSIASSNSYGYVWFAIFNGRTVVANTLYQNTPRNQEFKFRDYDVSTHTAIWHTYVMNYTSSTVSIRAFTVTGYGTLKMIISGYGYLTESNVVIKTDLTTTNLIDLHIMNDINAVIQTTTSSPVGIIANVTLNSSVAYALFKPTNTEYIRD